MATQGTPVDTTFLLRRLEAVATPTAGERALLSSIPGTIRHFRAHDDIVRLGDRPSAVCLVVEGIAARYKISADGKRQIMSFHLPGDIPDLHSLFINVMDHSLGALVPTSVLTIRHDVMCSIVEQHPRIAQLLWRETLIDAAVYREWIVMRDRPAYQRVAHLLCELFSRIQAIGLADGNTCELPLTQSQMGDALGLSNVHVNRTVQELRSEELIVLERGTLTILDWEGLKQAGEFDPLYLHLKRAA
jgi:CRP-like cAMP-binding protein